MATQTQNPRTVGAAMLFSLTMHVCLLLGFVQYSMHARTVSPHLADLIAYPPIEVVLLTASVPTFEIPAAKSAINQKPSHPTTGRFLSPIAEVLIQTSKPASANDLPIESSTSMDVAKDEHGHSTVALNSVSKANAVAEKKMDSEPAQTARPDYAYNPQPEYPILLREQDVGGVVWLRVWVDSEGRPGEIKLAKGSGFRLLDDAALRAVRQWRFIPARTGEQKLASWVEFPIRFTLNS